MKLKALLLPLAATAALSISAPAMAEFEQYKDYEVSTAVWEMTTVQVDNGQFETYLEGLKSTWIGANEVAKKLGQIEDYKIYANMAPSGDAFDLVLMIKLPSAEMLGPSKERYMAFLDAYGKENLDKGNETVLKLYNQIRKIQGIYLLQEITVK